MGVAERREREKKLRRDMAIKAAMEIYNEEGYYAITMEKIAERAELSRAALYLYFKNKDEIFINAIVIHFNYFADLLTNIYNRREEIKEDLLKELWNCFKIFHEKDPVALNATLYFHQHEAVRNLPDDLRSVIHESGSKVVDQLHKIIEYGVEKGIFIKCDPRTLAEVIWSSFLGIMQLEGSKTVISNKNHIEITRDLALRILSKGTLTRR
jgi:TetR/AcrR family transcriptional regulator